jgi:hypothetical protein
LGAIVDVRKKLEILAGLSDNWDDYGSPKITEAALEMARKVIDATPDLPDPNNPSLHYGIVPVPGGGIQFEMAHVHGAWLELEILPDGEVRMLTEANVLPEQAPQLMAQFARLQ